MVLRRPLALCVHTRLGLPVWLKEVADEFEVPDGRSRTEEDGFEGGVFCCFEPFEPCNPSGPTTPALRKMVSLTKKSVKAQGKKTNQSHEVLEAGTEEDGFSPA